MTAEHIAALKDLWQQAFGDADDVIDSFFATGFSPGKCRCIIENNQPVSALYWFDCQLAGQTIAYIYAVATDERYRGKGLAHRLMNDTHAHLKMQGYAGAVLVPGSKALFHFYEKMGYKKAATVTEFPCTADAAPVPLTQIDVRRYETLRKAYLPRGGVVQEGGALDYFATYGAFYEGAGFLLACVEQDGILQAREFLGNTAACGGILCALHLPRGVFRTPGKGKDFALYYPLQEDCPAPHYLGFALD